MRQCHLAWVGVFLTCVPSMPRSSGAEPPLTPIALTAAERDRCLSVLRSGLSSTEFWPSMHAAEALTLAGQQAEVIAALQVRLPQEKDDQHRCGLARELVRAGDRSVLPILTEILSDVQSKGRVHAAESLYKLGEVPTDSSLTDAMSQKENIPLRLMSAAAFARKNCRSARTVLRNSLASEDPSVRVIVGFALARLGDASDLDSLRERLAVETDPMARAYFVNALACLGDVSGRKLLGTNLSSSDAGIRACAAEHVGHARCSEHRPRLLELLDDPAVDVRVRAAQSLIELSLPL